MTLSRLSDRRKNLQPSRELSLRSLRVNRPPPSRKERRARAKARWLPLIRIYKSSLASSDEAKDDQAFVRSMKTR